VVAWGLEKRTRFFGHVFRVECSENSTVAKLTILSACKTASVRCKPRRPGFDFRYFERRLIERSKLQMLALASERCGMG
jgi:hypothetical protein